MITNDSLTLQAMRLTFPNDWTAYFKRTAPLVVEIGFGDGMFLVDLAKQHPDWNLIGIERAHAPMSWTERRVLREGVQNVRLIYGAAEMSMRCLFQPASVDTIYINFSDPWHKARHHKRRLIDQEFLHTLVTRLKTGGSLYIATDITDYAMQIHEALRETPGLNNAYDVDWQPERTETSVVTRYERKAKEAGRERYYFQYQRTTDSVAPLPCPLEEETMPNAVLSIPLDLDAISARFEPMLARNEDRVASMKNAYRSLHFDTLLVEAFVDEPLYEQHIMISIHQRKSGDYVVRMNEVGFPRPTPGVHDAVDKIVEWLVSLHPEAKILSHAVRT